MSAQFIHDVPQAATTDPLTGSRLGWLRATWYRIRFIVQEMNYAALKVQAPGRVDTQWHSR